MVQLNLSLVVAARRKIYKYRKLRKIKTNSAKSDLLKTSSKLSQAV